MLTLERHSSRKPCERPAEATTESEVHVRTRQDTRSKGNWQISTSSSIGKKKATISYTDARYVSKTTTGWRNINSNLQHLVVRGVRFRILTGKLSYTNPSQNRQYKPFFILSMRLLPMLA